MNPHLHSAQAFCRSVLEHAERYSLAVSVVAVDKGGHLIAMYRADRSTFASIEAARRKAVAASAMAMPTSSMVDMFQNDPLVTTALQAGGDMLIVPGGFPMIVDGDCVGGFGIAGGHYMEDEMLGGRAIAALAGREYEPA